MKEPAQNDIYDAIVAAFCLISYADGELHSSELARFVETISGDREFGIVDEVKLFNDVAARIADLDKDFLAGRARALATIQKVKNDFKGINKVIRAARIALVADGKIVEAEEVQLADIHRSLGLKEE